MLKPSNLPRASDFCSDALPTKWMIIIDFLQQPQQDQTPFSVVHSHVNSVKFSQYPYNLVLKV